MPKPRIVRDLLAHDYGVTDEWVDLEVGGGVTTGSVELPGGAVTYFDSAGDCHGRAIVLLHGIGNRSIVWSGVWHRLATEGRVVALDLPGFGASSSYRGSLGAEDVANAVTDFCSKIGIDRAVVVGHSLGGLVAGTMAALSSPVLERLVLIGSPPLALIRAIQHPLQAIRRDTTRGLLATGLLALGHLPAQDAVIRLGMSTVLGRRLNGHATVADYHDLPCRAQIVVDSMFGSGDFKRATENSFSYPIEQTWSAINCRVDAIVGEQDTFTTTSDVERFFELISNELDSAFLVLPKCGHLPMVEWPDFVASVINDSL